MECLYDPVSQEDFEDIASRDLPWEDLKGAGVLISGATGLIGSRLVFTLACANRIRNTGISIYALVRNRSKAELMFRDIIGRKELCILESDIKQRIEATVNVDFVVHGANPTSSLEFITRPADVIGSIFEGTKNLLEFSLANDIKSFVYLSSMEVYGTTDGKDRHKEDELGYIDIHNTRSSYSEGKRMAECLCACYANQYGLPVKIARLAQTFGAGVAYDDRRVFAQFARSVIEQRNIVLKSKGGTVRSYSYISDAVAAILFIMLRGTSKEVYNVANRNCILSIREMAELVADVIGGGSIKVVEQLVDTTALGYLPEIRLVLDSGKLEKLGWSAKYDMPTMYDRLIKSMKHSLQSPLGSFTTHPAV